MGGSVTSGGNGSGGAPPTAKLTPCPAGPYASYDGPKATLAAKGVGAPGRLVGGAMMTSSSKLFGLRDCCGSFGLFSIQRAGNSFAEAVKGDWASINGVFAPLNKTEQAVTRVVPGRDADQLWVLAGSVLYDAGPESLSMASLMLPSVPTAIEHSDEGVWVAGKAEIKGFDGALKQVVAALLDSSITWPSAITARHAGNLWQVLASDSGAKHVTRYSFMDGKATGSPEPLLDQPIVALATDCAGNTYAASDRNVWVIPAGGAQTSVKGPYTPIPCVNGCACPQITGMGFDDRGKLLATTTYTACDPSALWNFDIPVPGHETW
jgi:hypothetical protein